MSERVLGVKEISSSVDPYSVPSRVRYCEVEGEDSSGKKAKNRFWRITIFSFKYLLVLLISGVH